jgi:hypothetical protein
MRAVGVEVRALVVLARLDLVAVVAVELVVPQRLAARDRLFVEHPALGVHHRLEEFDGVRELIVGQLVGAVRLHHVVLGLAEELRIVGITDHGRQPLGARVVGEIRRLAAADAVERVAVPAVLDVELLDLELRIVPVDRAAAARIDALARELACTRGILLGLRERLLIALVGAIVLHRHDGQEASADEHRRQTSEHRDAPDATADPLDHGRRREERDGEPGDHDRRDRLERALEPVPQLVEEEEVPLRSRLESARRIRGREQLGAVRRHRHRRDDRGRHRHREHVDHELTGRVRVGPRIGGRRGTVATSLPRDEGEQPEQPERQHERVQHEQPQHGEVARRAAALDEPLDRAAAGRALGDAELDLDRPEALLVPRQRVAGEPLGEREAEHCERGEPHQLARSLVGAGERERRDVQHREHDERGRAVIVQPADEPAERDLIVQIRRARPRVGRRRAVVRRHHDAEHRLLHEQEHERSEHGVAQRGTTRPRAMRERAPARAEPDALVEEAAHAHAIGSFASIPVLKRT